MSDAAATTHAESVKAELRQSYARGQIHSGYLFEGGIGTGKRATALWLAARLLCRVPGGDPCGGCRDCRRMEIQESGRPAHPDLAWIEPDGNAIKIDQVRDLTRTLGLVANEGGWRVALVLGAERLNVQAANALLKTLEEPPPRTTLVLVADSSHGIPATLRSRMIRLRFTPMSESRVREHLVTASAIAERDAWLAAALGGGSADAALHWAQEHLERARALCDRIEGIGQLGASEILDIAEEFRGGEGARRDAELLLDVLAAVARHRVEQAAGESDSHAIGRWLRQFESAQQTRRELTRRNLNPQLVVEGVLLDLRASIG